MRRAHSVHEMRKYLERRSEEKEAVLSVIARLREQNYLDDARYAAEFARLHANSRRQGRFRIARELRARGVTDRHIEAAVDAVFAETDEASLVRDRIQRKLARMRGSSDAKIDQKKIASLYRSLLAAGFSGDTIRAEIRKATRTEAAELDETRSTS